MTGSVADAPRITRAVSGRVRARVPWPQFDGRALEEHLTAVPGVRSAEASSLTGGVLIRFDPDVVGEPGLLAALSAFGRRAAGPSERPRSGGGARLPYRLVERVGGVHRARIEVPGLERDSSLGGELLRRLRSRTGVSRAQLCPLTGRVLVEFDARQLDFESLLGEITGVDLPDVPDEDQPSDPLDPQPLIDNAARLGGAVAGLTLLAVRRATGAQGAPLARAAEVAAGLGIVEGLPPVREAVRRVTGQERSELVLGGMTVVSLALAGSPLGLAVSGASALRLVTEIRARRKAFTEYQGRAGDADAHPGAVVTVEPDERVPLDGEVVEGRGLAVCRDGLPRAVAPGDTIQAGARVAGAALRVRLSESNGFAPRSRPLPHPPSPADRYAKAVGPASLAYAVLTGVLTRSPRRAFVALMLVNPRVALIGSRAAGTGASARALRAGATVVGSRPGRSVRRPDVVVLDCPRVLAGGVELGAVVALGGDVDAGRARALAGAVARGAGSPLASAFDGPGGGEDASALRADARGGTLDGHRAQASVDGALHVLMPAAALRPGLPAGVEVPEGALVLLRGETDPRPLAVLVLRPRAAPGARELVATAERLGIELAVHGAAEGAGAELAARLGVPLVEAGAPRFIQACQRQDAVVAHVADAATAGEAFDACDLAIGLSSGLSGRFPARADVLAPDLSVVAALLDATERRRVAERDAIGLSAAANLAGAAWGLRGQVDVLRGSYPTYIGALAALGSGWLRERGGRRPTSTALRLVDPRPERWGREMIADVLTTLGARTEGLTAQEVSARTRPPAEHHEQSPLLRGAIGEMRSPLTVVLGAGAGISLLLGATADVVVIAAVIAANAAVSAWQHGQAGRVAEELERLGAPTARVLREGAESELAADQVVVGDILILASGDRVAADARLLEADRLEVDEAALTGESLPVSKEVDAAGPEGRVVLEGSDVTVGSGRAVVVAVGRDTRMGSVAAALAQAPDNGSRLAERLDRMLREGLPVAAAGGLLVVLAGLLWGKPLMPELALGTSIAISAVPEGLPMLAGVAQSAVARRLARHGALVRRPGAVEALGRVDIACADKTGTLTEGRLRLSCLAAADGTLLEDAAPVGRATLQLAALASPHPEAADAVAHPTDAVVVAAADERGLREHHELSRRREAPFDPARGFHATALDGRVALKGAVEVLAGRCVGVACADGTEALDDAGHARLLAAAERLAGRGLRVLMVAEGPPGTDLQEPQGLTARGFVGIQDPLRPEAATAIRRCRAAGVRVLMLTGDHPATAQAIAVDAGLLGPDDAAPLTGEDIARLDDATLAERLEGVSVVARISPLDKLRIVESLQRHGHTVAMTGDGVNDAPALRLADVGVAMGSGGTEVARQAADVVLADDSFAALVQALVEGRGFWQNIRRALGLLLGGNLGEIGLMVGASVAGLPAPMTTRQILTVNLVTDVLPAVAVAVQGPEQRRLASLAREGSASLDAPLRAEILRRGTATGSLSLAAYVAARRVGVADPRAVAYASVVATQLAQTLSVGRQQGQLSRSVLGGIGASTGLLVASLTVPQLRCFLGLGAMGPSGTVLILASAGLSVALQRLLSGTEAQGSSGGQPVLLSPPAVAAA